MLSQGAQLLSFPRLESLQARPHCRFIFCALQHVSTASICFRIKSIKSDDDDGGLLKTGLWFESLGLAFDLSKLIGIKTIATK